MRTQLRSTLVALVMAMALLVGLTGRAAASPAAQAGFPQLKQPSSARFDIMGTINSAGQAVMLSGSGAISGSDAEFDMTIGVSGSTAAPGNLVISVKLVDKVAYVKLVGLGGTSADKWYSIDTQSLAGMLPGGSLLGGSLLGGDTPGMGGMMGANVDPQLLAAVTITEEGKETVNGAATTRYRIDVDLPKLLAALGSSLGSGIQFAPGSTLVEYLWVGDADMYLHQMRLTANLTTEVSGSAPVTISEDISYVYHDFDTPITITAPEGAEPFSVPALPGTTGGDLPPVPVVPPTAPGSGSAGTQPTPGMPRTGAGDGALPLLPLAASLLLLASGLLLRRRSLTAML